MIPQLDEYKSRHHIESRAVIDLGLERMERALRALHHPERSLRIIHVAGTNGKGSTIAFLQSLLNAHGYTTGVFTSPAVRDVHDQIRHDGVVMTKLEMDEQFATLAELEGVEQLTDFELLTLIALLQFRDWDVDYVLLETGLGGRDDSTNVVTPIVSVITTIGLDHTELLGETVEQIARVKGGIIKPSVPVVLGNMPTCAMETIFQIAEQHISPIRRYNYEFKAYDEGFGGKQYFNWGPRLLAGPHQLENAAVAIATLHAIGLTLQEDLVAHAVETATYAYRFEQVGEHVWMDGAHNVPAAEALVRTIQETFQHERVHIAVGMLHRKDVEGVIRTLQPVARSFTFLTFPNEEAAPLSRYESVEVDVPTRTMSIDALRSFIHEVEEPLVITGSLYLLQMM